MGKTGRIEVFRVSYHGSGASRIHMLGVPTSPGHLPRTKPEDLKGAMRLVSGGPVVTPEDYVYKPKPNSPRRLTLAISSALLARAMCVDYWAIESGNGAALAQALLLGEPGDARLDLVGYILADWIKPNVAITVKTLPPDAWADVQRSFAAS